MAEIRGDRRETDELVDVRVCPHLVRSNQLLGYTSECVAASTSRRYSFGLRLAIAQADARPVIPISFR